MCLLSVMINTVLMSRLARTLISEGFFNVFFFFLWLYVVRFLSLDETDIGLENLMRQQPGSPWEYGDR